MAEAHARTFCTEKEDSKMQKMMIHYNDVPIYPIVLSENFDALGEALDDLMIKDRKACIVTDRAYCKRALCSCQSFYFSGR